MSEKSDTAFVYWDNLAQESATYRPRYYGFATIGGKQYRVSGDIDTSTKEKRVRLTFREKAPA